MNCNPLFSLGLTQIDETREDIPFESEVICNDSEQPNQSGKILQIEETPKMDAADQVRHIDVLSSFDQQNR